MAESFPMEELWIKIAFSAAGALVALAWFRFSLRRWRILVDRAFAYHRHHLTLLQHDHTASQRTREMATGMLWIMEKQLPRDEAEGRVNLRGLLRSMMVGGTSLQLLGDTYFQIYRYRYEIDDRIPRLLATLSSALYRTFFLHAVLLPFSLLLWDLKLLLAMLPFVQGGPMGLYRGLYRDLRGGEKN